MPMLRPDGGTGVSQGSLSQPSRFQTGTPGVNQLNQPPPAGYSNLSSLWNTLLGSTAPAIGNINAQVGNLYGQLGQVSANQGYQSGLLNQSLQNQLAGQGLQQDQLNIQRGVLDRQNNLAPQQNQLQQQLFGNMFSSLDQQQATSQYGYDRSRENLAGSAAARGANNTQGYTNNQNDLTRQLQDQLSSLDLSRSNIGIQQQQYGLNYNEQLAQRQDEAKNLDILSRKMGLDKSEIENRTNQALGQLGLSSTLTSGEIYNSILNAQNGIYDRLAPILGTIYQYTGIRPVSNG